ncbi:MAG: tRNA lysidine(34) synthetase TilS [Hyphomicrobiaceae bacterium]|nr:tRNA lysidine(34) synthetase TilS [Hyphomicrobiaceae bacterium]
MAAAGQPIGARERDRLLRDVRLPVAVAVSGGADSTALMHLVADWSKAAGTAAAVPEGVAPVLVLTVDHGLRPESSEEAAWVGREARRLGLAHAVLRWTGPKPRTAIQEKARAARYALISEHVGREPLPQPRQVLLAHHLDDQAETVLMRLARGSGVDGLSGMREVEPRIWLRLAHPMEERTIVFRRPLLAVPKSRLEATLAAEAAPFLHDPSNADQRYERVRLRAAAAARAALGLADDDLARTARRLASARGALEASRHGLARAAVDLHDGAWAGIDARLLADAPPELALRLLQSVIGAFGGQAEPPGRSQVEELLERLHAPGAAARTLGGAVIAASGPGQPARAGPQRAPVVAIHREPGRRPLPKALLHPGAGLFWDRRFYVSVAGEHGEAVRVEPLGQAGFARLKRQFPSLAALPMPPAAAAALPSLWTGDRLLAVACLGRVEASLAGPASGGKALLAMVFARQHVLSILGS